MTDFWARRKAAVEAEEAALAKENAEATEAEARAELEEKPDEEILRELELPDPDTLGEGDDFSAFLKSAVPERIRLRALRRLWTTNPVLANLDGLVEYGEDFTDAATVIENLQTAYQVGKGMTKHVLEMAKAEAGDEQAEPVEEPDGALTDSAVTEEPAESPDENDSNEMHNSDQISRAETAQAAEKSDPNPGQIADLDEGFSSKPRRMRYRFTEEH